MKTPATAKPTGVMRTDFGGGLGNGARLLLFKLVIFVKLKETPAGGQPWPGSCELKV